MAEAPWIQIKGGEQFTALANQFPEIFKEEMGIALNETLRQGEDATREEIKLADAVASGTVLRSVTSKINSLSYQNWDLSGQIEFKSPADQYVFEASEGRGPQPLTRKLVNDIRVWTKYRNIDSSAAFVIARKVAFEGTDKFNDPARRSFIQNSTRRIDGIAKTEFDKMAGRIQKRLDANANNNSSRT